MLCSSALRPALFLALSSVLACATGSARPLVLATSDGVECRSIGPVEGRAPGAELVGRETLLYWAEREALAEAAAKGATHVVLEEQESRRNEGRMSGFMYRCP